jgi:putative membrane protein
MKKVFAYGIAVLALSAAPALAQPTTGSQPGSTGGSASQPGTQSGTSGTTGTTRQSSSSQASSADHQFVMEAARGGMAEVELGQLAKDKAQSDAVKQFADRMITDHGKANDELKSLARSKSITLPADLDAMHKSTKDRLSKLSGAEFDRAYMQEMLSDHQKDVSEFQKESQSGSDPEIKAWAAKTLPTLQQHLQMAQAASRGAVGTSGTRSSGDRDSGGTRGTTPSTGGTSPRGQNPDSSGGSTTGSGSGSNPSSGGASGSSPR